MAAGWQRTILAAALSTLLLAACDPQRIDALEEGVATEADVRKQFGEPEKIWTPLAVPAPSNTAASPPATATT